jgi:hypothetical protein
VPPVTLAEDPLGSAAELLTRSVPALTTVLAALVPVLLPDRIRVPAPTLVSVLAP